MSSSHAITLYQKQQQTTKTIMPMLAFVSSPLKPVLFQHAEVYSTSKYIVHLLNLKAFILTPIPLMNMHGMSILVF